jgi:hypothetical protein
LNACSAEITLGPPKQEILLLLFFLKVSLPWSTPFDDQILLPKGRRLLTLRDAASYITKLPKDEHSAPEWQAAMEALILVAETGGPTMLARIGVMRALNRHVERIFDPDLKSHHWGKRKLKRDQ